MTDWLSEHAWAVWLSVAFQLASLRTVSLELVLIMFAAARWPEPGWPLWPQHCGGCRSWWRPASAWARCWCSVPP
jgi:hypothetical protein